MFEKQIAAGAKLAIDETYHDKATPPHFLCLFESTHAFLQKKLSGDPAGDMLLGLLEKAYIGSEQELADDAADAAVAFWDAKNGSNPAVRMAEPQVTTLMRVRVFAYGIPAARKAHPDWTRQECRENVHKTWTDDVIIENIKKAAIAVHGYGAAIVTGVSDWFQWLKDNWNWQIFFSIIGTLVSLLIFL